MQHRYYLLRSFFLARRLKIPSSYLKCGSTVKIFDRKVQSVLKKRVQKDSKLLGKRLVGSVAKMWIKIMKK